MKGEDIGGTDIAELHKAKGTIGPLRASDAGIISPCENLHDGEVIKAGFYDGVFRDRGFLEYARARVHTCRHASRQVTARAMA